MDGIASNRSAGLDLFNRYKENVAEVVVMPVKVRGRSDDCLQAYKEALERYEAKHPDAEIDLYRHGPMSVRIRVLDRGFQGTSWGQRHDKLWKYVKGVPDECLQQLSILLTLTPAEKESSGANMEFEEPALESW